jgi:predicted esterase
MENMFRASNKDPFSGPHQKEKIIYAGSEPEEAAAAVILIHGRGATAESIIQLKGEFTGDNILFAAPQASGFQWYPHSFLAPTERNEPGLSSGLQVIFDIIEDLEAKGIRKEKIIIAGFSQGACLASEFVARHPSRYGGLIAFSGGLIGDEVDAASYPGSLNGTPCFLGCSNIDPHIPLERVHESEKILQDMGAEVTAKIYKNMAHTINRDEVDEAQKIINSVISL